MYNSIIRTQQRRETKMCVYCQEIYDTDVTYSSSGEYGIILRGAEKLDQYLEKELTFSNLDEEPVVTWYLYLFDDEWNRYLPEQVTKCPWCGRGLD